MWKGKLTFKTCKASVLCCNLFRYDPKTDQWTTIANLSLGRDAIGVSPLGNSLFAVGGYSGSQYVKTVEFYDPDTNEWKRVCLLVTISCSLED